LAEELPGKEFAHIMRLVEAFSETMGSGIEPSEENIRSNHLVSRCIQKLIADAHPISAVGCRRPPTITQPKTTAHEPV
jgi:hypothetical protein